MDFSQYQVTQKMDGRSALKEVNGITIAGEQMRDGSFYAFDLIQDRPFRLRWQALQAFESPEVSIVQAGYGVEFIEAVFANPTAEGIVLKNWDTPFAYDWAKCKRTQVFYCTVSKKHDRKNSVELMDSKTGIKRGSMPLFGEKFNLVRVGSVLKVEAYGEHSSGCLREARPDKDSPTSWIVKI